MPTLLPKLLSLLSLLLPLMFFSVACLEKVQRNQAPVVAVERTRSLPALASQRYSSMPLNLVFFMWPNPQDITWESRFFLPSDTQEEKLSKIIESVSETNFMNDELDQKTFVYIRRKEVLNKELFQFEDDHALFNTDCSEFDDSLEQTKQRCLHLTTSIKELDETIAKLTKEKAQLLKDVLEALDEDTSNPVHWIKTELHMSQIVVPENPGIPENELSDAIKLVMAIRNTPDEKPILYTTEGENPDITDLRYYAEKDKPVEYLEFKLWEKRLAYEGDVDGDTAVADDEKFFAPTGIFYEAKLKKAFLEGVGLRFRGNIFKYHKDSPKQLLARGKMKILIKAL